MSKIKENKYMENLPEIVKPKLDIIFKRIFGDVKNKEIVMRFLSDMLEIPRQKDKRYPFWQCVINF